MSRVRQWVDFIPRTLAWGTGVVKAALICFRNSFSSKM